ncbi:MAG: bifunctional 2-polyprenyl-6-hydroxyphenol methylase/3-demethylubiquinol 3-O-methyltransferase UbiG [Sinobacteraceae bacterium]|nr:bifunctional 2-polyprenyl-6-hydroxyphenol methylase/3-demethylubiquinol 3-O-methyltransferase UbiG [Nevskiaceae bacterium]
MNTPLRAESADPAEVAKFDAAAHRFWDEHGEFRPLHRLNPLRLAYVAARCTLAGSRVADIGCGGGLLAEALAQRGANVTAIDLAPAMIQVARLHARAGAVQVDYRCESVESLAAAAAGEFDVVTCMEMLEHVPAPALTLQALASLLRPGGRLFVSTLNRNLRSFLVAIVGAEYLTRMIAPGTHEYERLIRPAELARWARAAGLELRDLAGVEFNPVTEQCRLIPDPQVNYLATFERPAAT